MAKLILFFLFLFSTILYGQEGEIIYKTYTTDTHKRDSEYAKRLANEIDQMKFSLRYTSENSIFEYIPYVTQDERTAKLARVATNALMEWYQDSKKRTAFYYYKIRGKKYTIVNDSHMKDWELSNESKTIDEFKAYKATLKVFNERTSTYSIVEAWYTPKLSLPYGPAGYGGLPGLILELKKGSIVYVMEEATMNPREGIKKFEVPNITNPISESDFVKLLRASRKVTPD
ncbi:GLPGLI family protein [Flagellimonas lutaonensis]|nr:GLPGLI family protein [Allomuricauda lutaonensis]